MMMIGICRKPARLCDFFLHLLFMQHSKTIFLIEKTLFKKWRCFGASVFSMRVRGVFNQESLFLWFRANFAFLTIHNSLRNSATTSSIQKEFAILGATLGTEVESNSPERRRLQLGRIHSYGRTPATWRPGPWRTQRNASCKVLQRLNC